MPQSFVRDMSTSQDIENRKSLTPKLRFKEFKGNWTSKKIEDITEKVNSGKTPLGGESVYVSSGVLFIRSQNVLDSHLSLDNVTYIPEDVNSSMLNSVVNPKDILLNITGASLGRSCVVPESFTIGNVNQHVCIVRLDSNNDPYFLQPIFASKKGQNLFESLQTGSGREGLNFQSIKSISLAFPSLPEQQKIASFLSAVDEKIQQLTHKKELLEQYKKGVMQQLFSPSGLGFVGLEDYRINADQTNPSIQKSYKSQYRQLRFKDENGKAYPKWEEKRLGEITTISTGASNRQDSGLDGKYVFFDRSQDIRTSSRFLFDGEAIIVPGEGQEFIPKYFIGKFDLHQRTYAVMNFKVSVGKYLYYFIYQSQRHFTNQAVGSTVKSLRMPIFESMKVNLPSSGEQQKIASFLTALDAKIESVATQITHTQTFKKGLLQQMFV
jgi:type I restriction enzyme, S subunit